MGTSTAISVAKKPVQKQAVSAPPDPYQEALRRAQEQYDQGSSDFRNSLLASGTIRDAIARAVAENDPLLSTLRTEKAAAQERLGTVFGNSLDDLKDITDPRIREQLRERRSAQFGSEAEQIGGQLSDLRGSQAATADKFANIFGATTQAKQVDLEQRKAALDRAVKSLDDETQRRFQQGQATEARRFESRFDDLTRREKEASIAATNRSNRGSGGGSLADLIKLQNNPLAAMQAGGYTRKISPDGVGFWFYDRSGKPVTVDQVANDIGTNKAALLEGSNNPKDQQIIQQSSGKPLSAAAEQQRINKLSGMQSLSTLEDLLNNKKISDKEMLTSKSGVSSLFASKNAKAYRDAARNIADIVARIRTGAQINEKEMELYLQYVPGPSDPPVVRKQKIETLKTIFSSAGSGAPTTSGTEADLEAML
jgi:hypothetical protein